MMSESDLKQLFEHFRHLHVLVIGDIMLDRYISGKVERISPEAPVPVVSVNGHEDRLGGAANVALNIRAMGARTTLASVIGHDSTGDAFLRKMEDEQLDQQGILRVERLSTLKMRIMGNKHQLLRVDEEDDSPLNQASAIAFREHLTSLMKKERFDVIIFEDYDKGLIDTSLIETVVNLATSSGTPVAVDPKKRNFSAYKNVTLFKPNLKEIREGLKTEADPSDKNSIQLAEQALRKLLNHSISLITLSEHGAFAAGTAESFFLPAHVRTISDVSGAGDTVISIAALCLAAGTDLATLAFLSNLAGGQVCEKPGVVPVDRVQLFEEARRFIN